MLGRAITATARRRAPRRLPPRAPATSTRVLLAVLDPVAVVALLVAVGITDVGTHATALAVMVVVASLTHLHRSRLVLSVLDEVPRLVVLAAAVVAGIALHSSYLEPDAVILDGSTALAVGGLLLLLLVVVRLASYAVVRRARRTGRVAHPTIVVGADRTAVRLTETLLRQPHLGLHPVGMVSLAAPTTRLPVPHLGPLPVLRSALVDLGVHDVVFAFSDRPDEDVVRAVRRTVAAGHQVFVVPRFFDLLGRQQHLRTERIHDVSLTRLERVTDWSVPRMAKRVLDVVLSLVALVLLSPLLVVLAVLARRETGGALFRQTRVGRLGQTFTLYKLQSLRPVAPTDGQTWNIDNDDRLGPVGRLIRRTGLDELPQLFNVLQGDMSLVGPRPERPHFVAEFATRHADYHDRHRVRAGITGWAQVHDLRGDTSIGERVRFDNHYIDDWSLWRDIMIMARTVPTLGRSQPAVDDPFSALAPTAGATGAPAPGQRR